MSKCDLWYITGEGKRPGEKILTKYREDGTVKHIASGFSDGNVYRLYPTNSQFSIKAREIVSIYLVSHRPFQK